MLANIASRSCIPQSFHYPLPRLSLVTTVRSSLCHQYRSNMQLLYYADILQGTNIIKGKAMLASGLTSYLQRRALDFGLPPGVTMYIWRRSAGK